MGRLTVVTGYTQAKPKGWDSLTALERMKWLDEHGASFHRRGFWQEATIRALALRKGFVGVVTAHHHHMDYSGKGRGYDAQQFEITL